MPSSETEKTFFFIFCFSIFPPFVSTAFVPNVGNRNDKLGVRKANEDKLLTMWRKCPPSVFSSTFVLISAVAFFSRLIIFFCSCSSDYATSRHVDEGNKRCFFESQTSLDERCTWSFREMDNVSRRGTSSFRGYASKINRLISLNRTIVEKQTQGSLPQIFPP